MAILSALRVSDFEDLRTEAQNFQNHANEIKKTTDEMIRLIDSTKGLWRGEAQTKYSTQFDGLNDDMTKIYEMCEEYSTDLIEIADKYIQTEGINKTTANALKADVDLR